jgi:hypothetical protein
MRLTSFLGPLPLGECRLQRCLIEHDHHTRRLGLMWHRADTIIVLPRGKLNHPSRRLIRSSRMYVWSPNTILSFKVGRSSSGIASAENDPLLILGTSDAKAQPSATVCNIASLQLPGLPPHGGRSCPDTRQQVQIVRRQCRSSAVAIETTTMGSAIKEAAFAPRTRHQVTNRENGSLRAARRCPPLP